MVRFVQNYSINEVEGLGLYFSTTEVVVVVENPKKQTKKLVVKMPADVTPVMKKISDAVAKDGANMVKKVKAHLKKKESSK